VPSPIAFLNGRLVLPDRVIADGAVVARSGRISAVGRRADLVVPKQAITIDAGGGFITPGFVDIHVHGGDGADFMDGTVQAVKTANRCHARHGTTTIFPTTTTGSRRQIEAMLEACVSVQRGWSPAEGARIGGVHIYGPDFAAAKVGCQLKSGRRGPDPAA
jgi:N-acetylglucosamine-6-phosphate deacetylase